MKKSRIAVAILSSLIGSAYAGSMGPVSSEQRSTVPFVSAEGSYNWSSFISNSSNTQQPWGGRLAVGVNHAWRDN